MNPIHELIESKVWRDAFNAAIATCSFITPNGSSDYIAPSAQKAVQYARCVADMALVEWRGKFGVPR